MNQKLFHLVYMQEFFNITRSAIWVIGHLKLFSNHIFWDRSLQNSAKKATNRYLNSLICIDINHPVFPQPTFLSFETTSSLNQKMVYTESGTKPEDGPN